MNSDAFRLQLEALSAEYRRDLPQEFATLDQIWEALVQGTAPPARMVDLQRVLHTLVGTAKTMGLPAVTDAAREAESFWGPFVERGVMPAIADQDKFRDLLDTLKRSANN